MLNLKVPKKLRLLVGLFPPFFVVVIFFSQNPATIFMHEIPVDMEKWNDYNKNHLITYFNLHIIVPPNGLIPAIELFSYPNLTYELRGILQLHRITDFVLLFIYSFFFSSYKCYPIF